MKISHTVSSIMTLYGADELFDSNAINTWIGMTQIRIHEEIEKIIGDDGKELKVAVVFDDQVGVFDGRMLFEHQDAIMKSAATSVVNGKAAKQKQNGYLRKLLQPSSMLKIYFRTTIEFNSIRKDDAAGDWNPNEMVAAGFKTPAQQKEYLDALKASDQDSASSFDNVESMILTVDGTLTTLKSNNGERIAEVDVSVVEEVPNQNTLLPHVVQQRGNTMSPDYILYYVIIGAASIIIIVFVVGGLYIYKTKLAVVSSSSLSIPSSSTSKPFVQDTPTVLNCTTVASDTPSPQDAAQLPPQITTTAATPTTPAPIMPVTTIIPREGEDDVSTLENPYFPNISDEPHAENTVGESMISSEHKGYVWEMNRDRFNAGDPSTVTGGNNTVISNNFRHPNNNMFIDDNTLEDIYQTPDGSYNLEGGDGGDGSNSNSNFTRLTVVAPPGKLGITFNVHTGNMPIVLTIEETSMLHGDVHVGDLVMSVDEIDCGGLSAVQVSRLISSRGGNPVRTLVLLRGSGSC